MLLLTTACSAKSKALRKEKRESEFLQRSVDVYWRALRWSDIDTAKAFVEGAEVRVAFDEWANEQKESQKITDIEVLNLDLGPELEEPRNGRVREATVRIRTEGYEMPEQIVREDTFDQMWYRTPTGWYVEWP